MVLAVMPSAVFASPSVIATGTIGNGGAPWRLYDNGTVVVDSGTTVGFNTPWTAHSNFVNRIVFTGPINAGTNFESLFSNLSNVRTIDGLNHIDTSNVTSMRTTFFGTSSLTELDISSWDTSNVTTMNGMFWWNLGLQYLNLSDWDTSNVTHMNNMFRDSNVVELNLSGWDTRNVTDMSDMFSGADNLQKITLGENFEFNWWQTTLPTPFQNGIFTGYWQNVGNGTVNNPQGSYVLTPEQLTRFYDGDAIADTWVWQRYAAAPTEFFVTNVLFPSWTNIARVTFVNGTHERQYATIFAATRDNEGRIDNIYTRTVFVVPGFEGERAITLPAEFIHAEVMVWERGTMRPLI